MTALFLMDLLLNVLSVFPVNESFVYTFNESYFKFHLTFGYEINVELNYFHEILTMFFFQVT